MAEPGNTTSEWKLTALVMMFGAALDAVGITLGALKDAGVLGGGAWLPVTLTVVGSLMMVAKAMGYTRSRTLVKMAEQMPATTTQVVEAAHSAIPLAQTVREVVREELARQAPNAKQATLPPGTPPQR